ncbi:MAG: hypothetical protein NTW25_00270 [Candidatus Kapabacteria bacterium]|nr:hypothetical protein [Candidatus Kapabacteria bacterium]
MRAGFFDIRFDTKVDSVAKYNLAKAGFHNLSFLHPAKAGRY